MTPTQTSSPTNAPFGISTYTDQAVQEWFLNRTKFGPADTAEWADWIGITASLPNETLIPAYDRGVFGGYTLFAGQTVEPRPVGYVNDTVHDGWDAYVLPADGMIIRVTPSCAHVFVRISSTEWRKATFQAPDVYDWTWKHGHLRVAAAVVTGAPLSPVFELVANSDGTAEAINLWSPSQNNMPEVGAKVTVERNDGTFEGGEIVFIDPDPDTANPVRVIFSDGEDVWAPLYDVHPLDADAGE